MDNNTEAKELEIDFSKIFYKMRDKFVIILVVTLAAAVLSGLVTHFAIKPQYSSTVKMYVYSNSDRISTDSSISSSELDASQELINTYIYILKSDTVLEAVMKDLSIEDISLGQLRNSIDAQQATKTVAFEVTVTTDDASRSAQIANSIAKIAPSEIVRVAKAGGVEIIDYAKIPSKPSSPNLTKNVLVAALLAFAVSFIGFFVYEFFDTTITGARDIEDEFDIPIIGTVPNLDNPDLQSNYSTYSAHTKPSSSSSMPELKPSPQILENLQNMKGEDK